MSIPPTHQQFITFTTTPIHNGDSEDPLPEKLFLDYRILDVLDKTIKIPRVEPCASRYCAAISEKRYGDAIYARYHMDGRAQNDFYTDIRENESGNIEPFKMTVYDLIMEDARGYAQEYPEFYREALQLYSTTSPKDTRRDIIEGLSSLQSLT